MTGDRILQFSGPSFVALLWLACAAIVPTSECEARPHLRLGLESGTLNFSDVVDIAWFAPAPEGFPQSPEFRSYRYAVAALDGFELGVQLRHDIALTWSHTKATSRMRYWLDKEEVFDNQTTDNGIENRLPAIDLQLDVIHARWTPAGAIWRGVGPVIGLGWGWLDQTMDGEFNTEGLPDDWSASDGVWDITIGLEHARRVSAVGVRASLELRSLHWKFVVDHPQIPDQEPRAWLLGGRIVLEF